MFQALGQNQTFSVHAPQKMLMVFETSVHEEVNKLELYVHAAKGSVLSLKVTLFFLVAWVQYHCLPA